MITPLDKAAVFIDGSNLYAAARGLDMQMDYKRMLEWLGKNFRVVRAHYYTAIAEGEDGYSPLTPMADWLSYNGFSVVTKPAKTFTNNGVTKVKGNMDIEMAVDALELAPHVDQIILFTGDGDFTRLVQAIQRKGVRVVVISTIKSQPPMMSDELRRQADEFIELDFLRPHIEKVEKAVKVAK